MRDCTRVYYYHIRYKYSIVQYYDTVILYTV